MHCSPPPTQQMLWLQKQERVKKGYRIIKSPSVNITKWFDLEDVKKWTPQKQQNFWNYKNDNFWSMKMCWATSWWLRFMKTNQMTVKSFKKREISNGLDGIEDDALLEKVQFWTITMVIVSVIVLMKISVDSVTTGNFLQHYHFDEQEWTWTSNVMYFCPHTF